METNKWLFRPTTISGLLTLFIAFMGSSQAAVVSPSIDFAVSSQTSTTDLLDFNSGTGILSGTNIAMGDVKGQNTDVNSGAALTCVGCFLEFDAEYVETIDGTLKFAPNVALGLGEIIVHGTLYDGTTQITTGTTPLLSGLFEEASLSVDTFTQGAFSFEIAGGSFSDTKNPDLLNFYGINPGSSFEGGLTILFSADLNGTTLEDGFSSQYISGGSISNTLVAGGGVVVGPPVPIPAAALLFVPAFLGIAAFSSFRRKKTNNNDRNSSFDSSNGALLPA